MSVDKFDQILKTFEVYLNILEIPTMTEQMEWGRLSKAFECSKFIEILISKVRQEEKVKIFEDNLNHGLAQKGIYSTYKCSDFEKACDKMLEIYMKDARVPTEKVDMLFNLYIQNFGKERLKVFLEETLISSMCVNSIINSMVELGVAISELHDEALLATWDKDICSGKLIGVSECVDKMLDDGHILKLVNFVLNNDINPMTKNIIIKIFTSRAFNNDSQFLKELMTVDAKSLLQILSDNSDFCINFLDTVFYFGRSMAREEDNWISDQGVKYKDIAKMFRILLEGSDDVCKQTKERLDLAKEMDGEFWEDIERDCIRLFRTEIKKREI